jgi:Saxitoxin biosynthesis operon protein SxtJ
VYFKNFHFPNPLAKHKSSAIERSEAGMIGRKDEANAGQTTHESFVRDENIATGSDRSFGFVMAAVFAAVSALNAWHSGRLWPWTATLSAVFFAAGIVRPAALHRLNLLWLKFGLLLSRIVSPIVMALLFFGTVLPTGIVMRMMGKDLLRLKRQAATDSYWIVRSPPGPSPESMRDQF